jgi:hypothetical protein
MSEHREVSCKFHWMPIREMLYGKSVKLLQVIAPPREQANDVIR